MAQDRFRFLIHPERLAIARLEPDAAIPEWARGGFVTITRTAAELSVIAAQVHVPSTVLAARDKLALGIVGVVPMTSVGILAALCSALAAARVPVFAVSTYDTDWLLVDAARFPDARRALEGAGHGFEGDPPAT